MMRLDKYLAERTGMTRSESRKTITKGRVMVAGKICRKADTQLDETAAQIALDGAPLAGEYKKYVYIMLNKPEGVVSASRDKRDTTVVDLVAADYPRRELFPAGRLDKTSTGFVLLTDDGALAHDLLAPKKHVDKVYFVRTDGALDDADCKAFVQGIMLGDGLECLPAKLEILKSDAQSEALITIHEGKFHQIKRMLASRGKPVVYLKRLSMGSLTLDEGLSKGEYRLLTAEEIKNLRESGQFAQGKAGADK